MVNSLQDPVEVYFQFRTRFLTLKQALNLNAVELEQLIFWHYVNSSSMSSEYPLSSQPLAEVRHEESSGIASVHACTVSRRENMVYKKGQEDTNHAYLQWLLAKLGLKVGCSVWIAIDDHEKLCNEEKLGDLSLPSLPILADSVFQQIIQHIDILWLSKNEVIAAYEIGRSTKDVSKSLLRLSDLAVLLPKRDVQFYVVTPQASCEQFQFELSRPIFQNHNMHKRSKVIIQEYLVQHAEHILRWASSPSVIQDLTLHLSAREQ